MPFNSLRMIGAFTNYGREREREREGHMNAKENDQIKVYAFLVWLSLLQNT